MGESFLLTPESCDTALLVLIQEYVASYYEEVDKEYKKLQSLIDGHNNDLYSAVNNINNLLHQYKQGGTVDEQFIRYINKLTLKYVKKCW